MKPSLKTAAIVTIHDASKMTPRGRREIAKWLRSRAALLEKEHAHLASRFTSRYYYTVAGDFGR